MLALGGAALTGAGRLDYRSIIHVAGINMLWRASENSFREQRGFASVAFPIIGAGSGGFDSDRALAIMVDSFRQIDCKAQVRIVRYSRPV